VIRPLTAGDAEACDAIIAGLPEWFELEEGIAECASAVRTQHGLVARSGRLIFPSRMERWHQKWLEALV